jgi:hypothetical protein
MPIHNVLGEISSEEDARVRGVLSVVVVHKSADMHPGPGFVELGRVDRFDQHQPAGKTDDG